MRASVHVDLPGWTKHGLKVLEARCEELQLQPRGTRGESGGQTGFTYDISNKHRLGYSEVELVQKMIDGVNTLWKEDKELQKKYFGDFPFIASQHSLVAKHVRGVFERLAKGIKAVGDSVKKESGKDFCLDAKYGYIHSCPTNLGTGMRASVHVDLPGWTKHSIDKLKARCEELHLQPRGTRGESGGQTGFTYDISNKHRLGYSEVELVQKMIDGVNTLWKEDKEFQKKYNM